MDNVKKVTQKDRYGNQVSFEFESEIKPIDQTEIIKEMMKNMQGGSMEMPEMDMQMPQMDHPGGPKGTDTVPAWLTPGEFVVNAEAMRIPGAKEQIEAINDEGRAMQQMQGGSIPGGYQQGGQIPFIAGPRMNLPQYQQDGGDIFSNPAAMANFQQQIAEEQKYLQGLGLTGTPYSSETEYLQDQVQDLQNQLSQYKDSGGWVTEELLDKLREVESGGDNNAVSHMGAVGAYQWLPKSAAKAGYGVKPFDPKDEKAARAATKEYLINMQKHHGFTPEETLRAYNWGPRNVVNFNSGKRKDIPNEALNYPEKILGKGNTQGIIVPNAPVPKARPDGLTQQQDIPQPKLKSKEVIPQPKLKPKEEVAIPQAKPNLKGKSDNPFEAGSYAYEQFEKNRPGQVDFTPDTVSAEISPDAVKRPEASNSGGLFNLLTGAALGFEEGGGVQSNFLDRVHGQGAGGNTNIVAPLTDVPSGHKMFGGTENLGGDTSFENNIPEEAPWYNNLLGHRLKQEGTLTDNEKRLADEQTSSVEKLSGPEIAEEENQIAGPEVVESVEDDLVNSVLNGPKVPPVQVDDISTDDHKTEIVKENSTEIAEINANKSGKAQTGPDKNQPGQNKSETEVEAAGKKAPEGFVEQAKSALVGAFGDLFDPKELGRMAIMYAGSRLLGYSHGGSLQFAGKQYVTRIDAKNANHQKYVQDLTKSGKYTAASIAAYNKSKDVSDLQAAGVASNPTGQFKTFYNSKGQKVRAQQVKRGKETLWVGSNGQRINSSYSEDASQVVGTKEYGARIKADSSQYSDMIKGLRSQFGTTKLEGKPDLLATDLVPAVAGTKIAKWALDNKVPPEYMGSIVENAYHGAIAHSRQTGEKVRDLTSFLNNQYVISQVGDPLLFTNKDGSTVSGPAVSKLMSTVTNTASQTFGKKLSTTQVLQGYRAAWSKLGDQEKNLWNEKATKEETGFMKFIQDDVFKSIK